MNLKGKKIMVVGGTGKIGKHFTPLLVEKGAKVSTVALFSGKAEQKTYEKMGIKAYHRDMGKVGALKGVPRKFDWVFNMVGLKFGSEVNPDLTLRVNVYAAAQIMEHFAPSGVIAYASSGNVYPDTKAGADESVLPIPASFYALTRVGAEMMTDWYSRRNKTKAVVQRIFYAYNKEFGVPADIARQIRDGQAVDLSTSKVNVIWNDDLMEQMIKSMAHGAVPARIINLTSPQVYKVRDIANKLGKLMGKKVRFKNKPKGTNLLADASLAKKLFGLPRTSLDQGLKILAESVMKREFALDKPAKWEKRSGF
ncbi:MAG: NAD-dependent epimerase/dehydratase family protein [Anaerolineaceae bacterium]|nr:NAD-dependent epimerase/dehydratase family protein [Anaerolineaceae bacterium]